jgi:hypothetical protein
MTPNADAEPEKHSLPFPKDHSMWIVRVPVSLPEIKKAPL